MNRSFVLLVRELGLVGGTLVAIDGSLFHGDASKASIFTRKRLAEQIAKLDQEIEAYGKSLEDNDAAEAGAASPTVKAMATAEMAMILGRG